MGKNVLIIGASGDIGIAISKILAKEGYHLLLHYYTNDASIKKLRQMINNQDCILTEIQVNLSLETDIQRFITQIVYSVDIIIFAGGNAYYGLFQDMTEQTIDDMLKLHVKAPLLITKNILPQMIQKRTGKIIFVTSIWGR